MVNADTVNHKYFNSHTREGVTNITINFIFYFI